MMTNTFLPYVGGVERSVQTFTNVYREQGHRVLIVAPTFENMTEEVDVVRVPALQKFNGTDFSIQLPVPGILNSALREFRPDIVHSHHPFMIGDSALRIAAQFKIPIVYTFHTFYECYTHYVPGDSPALKRFVVALATGYANLCDAVFAPSRSVAEELRRRGVVTAINAVPTGIPLDVFETGSGREIRIKYRIPPEAFLVGFVSRLAPEKNLEFTARSVKRFLAKNPNAHFIVVGSGPSEQLFFGIFGDESVRARVHATGILSGRNLIDTYHAMDVFAFASQTETQGLVLTEALASGIPVVALDGPGVGEIVTDRVNGRLLSKESENEFADALEWIAQLSKFRRICIKENSRKTAAPFSQEACAARALKVYSDLLMRKYVIRNHADSTWEKAKRLIKTELDLILNVTRATGAAISDGKA